MFKACTIACLAVACLLAPLVHAAYTVPENVFELVERKAYDFKFVGSIEALDALPAETKAIQFSDSMGDLAVPKLARFSGLRALEFKRESPLSAEAVSELSNHSTLEHLSFHGCLSLAGHDFSALLNLKNLTSLRLSGVPRLGVATTETISQMEQLEILEVAAIREMSDECFQKLGMLKNLRALDASFAQIEGPGLKAIAALPQLQFLDIGYCSALRPTDLAAIAQAKCLVGLCLADIADRSAVRVASQLPKLAYLDLRSCSLTDDDLKSLPSASKLAWLDFKHNNELTDQCIEHVMKCAALKHVNLGWTEVTDGGVKKLGDLDLRILELEGCDKLTDACIQTVVRFANLEALNLSWVAGLTSDGVSALKKCTKLRKLGLNYCKNVSRKAALEIAQSLTDCEVCRVGLK
jgi:hypothetical protein